MNNKDNENSRVWMDFSTEDIDLILENLERSENQTDEKEALICRLRYEKEETISKNIAVKEPSAVAAVNIVFAFMGLLVGSTIPQYSSPKYRLCIIAAMSIMWVTTLIIVMKTEKPKTKSVDKNIL